MRVVAVFTAGALLAGCAGVPSGDVTPKAIKIAPQAGTPPPVPVRSPLPNAGGVTALGLNELSGRTVLIFPDVSPAQAFDAAGDFASRCLPDLARIDEPHGFQLLEGDALQLRVGLGRVSQSSALALDGPLAQEPLKSALGKSITGELGC